MLGSFPGARSLKERVYYGNPQNHFWLLIARIFDTEVPTVYEERCELLLRCGIAVWDVYESCEREGSLDAAIRNPVANDFAGLLKHYPTINRVLLNGSTAYAAFAKVFGLSRQNNAGTSSSEGLGKSGGTVKVFRLPSTSPVPSRAYRNIEDKLAPWRAAFMDS